MKIRVDYSEYFKGLCDSVSKSFEGKSDYGNCSKKFEAVCRHLSYDFLPPINREDLAVIAYLILRINKEIELNSLDFNKDVIDKIIRMLPETIDSLINKKKTCESYIRRLTDMNYGFYKMAKNNHNAENFAKLIDDLTTAVLNAYFKNL